jgi:hypothetical protein
MLETDRLHRTGPPLEPRFRALVRWAAADANCCEYGRALAEADYARDTGDKSPLAAAVGTPQLLSPRERRGIAFARQMMRDAACITDTEVAWLKDDLGEERLVALVLLLAHASFQDRILLALATKPEPEGVPPPVQACFARSTSTPPGGPPPPSHTETGNSTTEEASDSWHATRAALQQQKDRPGRIAIPSADVMVQRLGPDHAVQWQRDIVWSRVCYVHQPLRTDAWFATVAAARSESQLDAVFTNSIFWVVTDSLRCFY